MILQSATFSNKCKQEIIAIYSNAKSFKKIHVPQIGYVYFIKNQNGKTIAKCYRDNGKMKVVN